MRKRLDGIRIVAQAPRDTETVYFGAWFELRDSQGQLKVFRLVGPDEFDFAEENISMDSPLGIAVMGKSLQDEVVFDTPDSQVRYTLVRVSYETL